MATSQDAISRLQIDTSESGLDETTDKLNKLAEAYGSVTVQSSSTEKATASLDSKFASIERRYVDGVKAQQDYAKIQNTVNAAVAQNPALTDRANAVLASAKQRYEALTSTQSTYEKSVESIKDKASELTGELGPLGGALRAIGPAGLAIGAAIGVAVLAMDKLKEAANEAGQWASQLQNAANVIGLNTTQLQALNEAAGNVGVSANDNVAAFEKFSVSLGQLRDGSGNLYSELQKVSPALVNQLSVTKDAATGWNLLAQAYAQADKQQQALIARAAFGRGGAAVGGVLLATANAGGIGGLEAANEEDAISKEQVQRWADLTVQINSASEAAKRNFASIFTTEILERQKNFADNMLAVSQWAKQFSLSEDWAKFMAFVNNPITQTVLSALGHLVIPAPVGLAASVANSLTTSGAIPKPQATSSYVPNFDATFDAVSRSNAATSTASLGVQATQARDLVSALGSAATASDTFKARYLTLQQAFDAGKLGAKDSAEAVSAYGRALEGLKIDRDIAQQAMRSVALAAPLTVAQLIERAKKAALRQDNNSDERKQHSVPAAA